MSINDSDIEDAIDHLGEMETDEDATTDTGDSGNDTEDTNARLDLLSNGFKQRITSSANNKSGATYIYMAFGQSIVGSNDIPATAR